jgi:hypothetical protein
MTLSTTSPGDEREAFETWRKSMHNGYNAWDAWQARASLSSSTVQQVGADDTARLDWLERRINEDGAIHLHDGKHPHGTGLGLRPGLMVRTLRQAIDQAMPKSEGDQQ